MGWAVGEFRWAGEGGLCALMSRCGSASLINTGIILLDTQSICFISKVLLIPSQRMQYFPGFNLSSLNYPLCLLPRPMNRCFGNSSQTSTEPHINPDSGMDRPPMRDFWTSAAFGKMDLWFIHYFAYLAVMYWTTYVLSSRDDTEPLKSTKPGV